MLKKADFLKKLGKSLEKKILERGYLTLEQFAHENNLAKSTLYMTVKGQGNLSLYKLYEYASALEIPLSDLTKPLDNRAA